MPIQIKESKLLELYSQGSEDVKQFLHNTFKEINFGIRYNSSKIYAFIDNDQIFKLDVDTIDSEIIKFISVDTKQHTHSFHEEHWTISNVLDNISSQFLLGVFNTPKEFHLWAADRLNLC